MRVLNAAQMREADRITIDEIGIRSLVLMECAGRQVVADAEQRVEDLADSRVAVLCGPGNNGGDGFVVARTLLQAGHDVAVFLVGRAADVERRRAHQPRHPRPPRPHHRRDRQRAGVGAPLLRRLRPATSLVDALFGTGLSRPLTGLFETIVRDVNASDLPVVAIDLPSGLSGSTADVIGPAIEADLTVTFAAPKLPHVLPPAEAHCGEVVTVEIGIPAEVVEALDGPRIDVITRERVAGSPRAARGRHPQGRLRARPDRGRLGGRRRGPPTWRRMAALRSGAGLVTVATPASVVPIIASMAAELMTLPLAERDGRLDVEARARGDPGGHGRRDRRRARARYRRRTSAALVFGLLERSGAPLVLDADALTVCAGEPDRLRARDGLDLIITPHPGEMAPPGRPIRRRTCRSRASRWPTTSRRRTASTSC